MSQATAVDETPESGCVSLRPQPSGSGRPDSLNTLPAKPPVTIRPRLPYDLFAFSSHASPSTLPFSLPSPFSRPARSLHILLSYSSSQVNDNTCQSRLLDSAVRVVNFQPWRLPSLRCAFVSQLTPVEPFSFARYNWHLIHYIHRATFVSLPFPSPLTRVQDSAESSRQHVLPGLPFAVRREPSPQ